MSGSMFFGVPSLDTIRQSLFGDDFFDSFFSGDIPEGTRTYRKNILDDDGKKVGEEVVRTYSSGKTKAPASVVRSSFPPCNIYTNDKKQKVYEFACAGYDPKNISFEVNEDNPSYINLVLKSDYEEVDNNSEDKDESVKTNQYVYDYKQFNTKNHTCPFYVDRDRYDIESAEVEIANGVVKITFDPKKVKFSPKIKLIGQN